MHGSKLLLFLVTSIGVLSGLNCKDNAAGNYGSYVSSDYIGTNNTKYLHRFYIIDSLGNTIENFVDTVAINTAIEEKKIGAYDNSIRIDAYSSSSFFSGVGERGVSRSRWYARSGDTVLLVGYRNAGGMYFPKRENASIKSTSFDLSMPFAVKRYLQMKRINADSIYLPEQKRAIYIFPLYAGKQWSGFAPFYWFKQIRKVESEITVQTAAGVFPCYKIRTSINSQEFLEDEIWYDFVSKEGIILRTIELTIKITTEVNPDGIGRAKVYERLEMISK